MKYIAILCLALTLACTRKEEPLFRQLSPEETGVDFANIIEVRDTYNILDFEYTYNGGGVATADFNNDGLVDLFFTGNMVENRLYLNKGNFKFEDITAKSGLGGVDRWNSGVSVVDINYDGYLDLYVCASIYPQGPRRANRLFVNQGPGPDGAPAFKEMAAQYGVADTTHTTTAAFFDYDNDGDLDLFTITDEMESKRQPNVYRKKVADGTSINNDHLYRNDFDPQLGHPVFTEVTQQARILSPGYSLGLNICDINLDGWKDILVTNDYLSNDLLYINNQDGTFTDRAEAYFKHTCYAAMGNDVNDLNNDGWLDVIALDMQPEDNFRRKTMLPPNNYVTYINNEQYGYQHQYVRNVLQINQGPRPDTQEPLFSEIAMQAGISATDWSWCPMVADFDNDGWRDIIITNGFPKDVTDRDFIEYYQEVARYVAREDALDMIPSVKLKNYAFRNRGDASGQGGSALSFENMGEKWGIKNTSFSNGGAYADLDNDGDLDYVVNNINDPAFVFKNESQELAQKTGKPANYLRVKLNAGKQNPLGIGTFVSIYYQGKKQVWEHNLCRGYLSSIEPIVHFGLGAVQKVDSLVVEWQTGKRQVLSGVACNQVLQLSSDKATAALAGKMSETSEGLMQDITQQLGLAGFQHQEIDVIDFNIQRLLPHKLSQYGPKIAVSDINGDGLEDFYVGGARTYKGAFFVQQADGTFLQQDLLPGMPGETKREEEIGVCFFDADGDGDADLYATSGSVEWPITESAYQDRLFINNEGRFTLAGGALPAFLKSGSCVRPADIDKDGDLDLFVGARSLPNEYPKPVSSYLLKNESAKGSPRFVLAEAPALQNIGMVCDAAWSDFDGDGWQDLVLAGDWMPITFLKNKNGRLENITSASGIADHTGWWNSITTADIDHDGDMDFIAGNLGLNTLFKSSAKQPLRIYGADFDDNGYWDAIPTGFFPAREDGPVQEYPFFTRIDVQKQVVQVRKHFLYHRDFGGATMSDFLSKFKTKDVLQLEATYLQSAIVKNLGKGKFELIPLPSSAQMAPIFGLLAQDFSGDGHVDILAVGNDFGTEVGQGRMDALNGLLMLGDGKGGFVPTTPAQSGILVPGDAKDLKSIRLANGTTATLASQNRSGLRVFQPRKKKK